MKHLQKVFGDIYDRYVEKIYRFVYIKVNSSEIAEDLTSETFLRCWQKFKKESDKIENIQAFLYQIARNLVVDYYRQKGRMQFVPAEKIAAVDPHPTIEEKAFIDSDLEEVKTAVRRLKNEYQEIVIWHYIDDLSVPEIAGITNKSEGAIRVMLHRALKALKDEVQNKTKEA